MKDATPLKDILPAVLQSLSNPSRVPPVSTTSNQPELRTCLGCFQQFPVAELAGHSRCPRCLKANQAQAQADRGFAFQTQCPKLYQLTDPARLPAGPLAAAMRWNNGPRGLILTGDTGAGKTRIAWMLLLRVLVHDPKPITFHWFDCVSFGHETARHYHTEDAEEWLENTAAKQLLFFDDLGKLKLTERAEAELFGLVERRCSAMLPIIATTNDSGDSLAARMTENRGAALIRRLREFCDVVHVEKERKP